MTFTGNLLKLSVQHSSPVSYTLVLSNSEIKLNDLLGKSISLSYKGVINCVACGKTTKSSFAQGYCYSCFQTSPETEPCILRPELCKIHLDEARDLEWAREHHLQPHVVYLAYSSNLKVGVTRATQVPTRWIDQGATMALPFLKVPNRHIAGVAEVFLKQKYADKTSWSKMLMPDQLMPIDLKLEVEDAINFLPSELQKYRFQSDVYRFEFPVNQYPHAPKSVSLDKKPSISGILSGIKGQYLMFESGEVINIRKHNGYLVDFSCD